MKAWSMACESAGVDDCGFFVREHDKGRLARFAKEHMAKAHGMELDDRTLRGFFKPAKW